MTKPLVVTVSHDLGQAEAVRRMQEGLSRLKDKFGRLITIDEETWVGNRLALRVRAAGQSFAANVDVLDDRLRLEVTLPWLLAKISERLIPTIEREGTLLLEKK